MSSSHLVFLLSPANCSGIRAGYLFRKDGESSLAQRLHAGERASIAEIFTFMSGLYFRGKLKYAAAFGTAAVIVPGRGLLAPDTPIDLGELQAIARVPVDPEDRRYLRPLQRDARQLAEEMEPAARAVLLGSLATPKYLHPLRGIFGERLRVPSEFVGRGDMSRGSLMLRCAAEGRQLTYIDAAESFQRVAGNRTRVC